MKTVIDVSIEAARTTLSSPERTAEQQSRLARFGAAECVDIHCHCVAGLDDGPGTLDDALRLCRALVADGITTVIATPHQLGRYDVRNTAGDILTAVATLRAELVAADVPLAVEAGADVRIDERLVRLLGAGEVLGLGPTGRYVLLEMPHETYIEPRRLLDELVAAGRCPVLTHPERHPFLVHRPQAVEPWIAAGGVLQVTAGSLSGAFGPSAEAAAWGWLSSGRAQLVATDAHDVRARRPMMSAAVDRVTLRLGHLHARRLFIENPLRVLRGEALPAIPAAGR